VLAELLDGSRTWQPFYLARLSLVDRLHARELERWLAVVSTTEGLREGQPGLEVFLGFFHLVCDVAIGHGLCATTVCPREFEGTMVVGYGPWPMLFHTAAVKDMVHPPAKWW
jgi:hypothetical protein